MHDHIHHPCAGRRHFLRHSGLALAALGSAAGPLQVLAQTQSTLTIAYNVDLPSWDPTVGPSAVNPTIQSLYKAVFSQFIDQNPDLSLKPDLLSEWGWNADKTQIGMTVRRGAKWHDGSAVSAEDVAWSLRRAGDPKTGNPIQFVWSKVGNVRAQGDKVIADVKEFEPAFFKWMAFLTGYVLPRAHYEKVGAAGFERKPVGSGPYQVEEFVQGSHMRLRAFKGYFGPQPAFETVVVKFTTDPSARVAELESGRSDLTLEIPYEEAERLRGRGFNASIAPVSDIGMIFLTNVEPMTSDKVRQALTLAVDKKGLAERLLKGHVTPIDTLQAKDYAAFDAGIGVPFDARRAAALMAEAGYSRSKPLKFKVQTTRGFKPKDFEVMQAIAGMWKAIGADVELEVYEVAKHYELRAQHKLAPAAFYNWGNSIGDPSTSTGFAMFSHSPHSAWKDPKTLDALIAPLWGEKDEAKRIAGYKAVDRYIADNALVIPLFQYSQTVVYRKGLRFAPHGAGFVLPQTVGRA
ncbi:ABC transporter substrate-binding protein [Verminephrobacter eiseniae]|uniref:ABC transporter substrate-binding protein n=1 Tax=Verminephrobacter eiseniae TaxID=364317 RepID=UPI0010E72B7C|nr:ABC transporter substrate-binding protein [Verminephrobacter eiseniae]KAB7553618.1 peptide ABC transporter substrate-binding protein [Verminephrobacter sp. Larva24]MCW5234754.1 peptide ABC transporter substrate-binding protein [Verminephrobacter eiseniae]MCW5293670.1 peptide ABC transporter substrate-binding protein [Verminephrobacter eiseniae]MCW8187378.1 peptide ABC transporter substrate-binding protein [Verminephrobacter eiseniae]MCW8226002.1 peptide ABC transporter substrate-binding pro